MALLLVLAVDGNFNKAFILNDILCDAHKYNKVKFYGCHYVIYKLKNEK